MLGHIVPCTYEYCKAARCRDDHRHITAQQLSDPLQAIVMAGEPALVEGEIKGRRHNGRFALDDIACHPIHFC